MLNFMDFISFNRLRQEKSIFRLFMMANYQAWWSVRSEILLLLKHEGLEKCTHINGVCAVGCGENFFDLSRGMIMLIVRSTAWHRRFSMVYRHALYGG